MDSAILPSYTCPFKFLCLTVAVSSGACLLFLLLYHHISISFWRDHVGLENGKFYCYCYYYYKSHKKS